MTDHRITAEMFVDELNAKFADRQGPYAVHLTLDKPGRKFIRIIDHPGHGGGALVHAFVSLENGALLKAAGWKAPAKGDRYDLSTPEGFALAVEKADPYGSYLYY